MQCPQKTLLASVSEQRILDDSEWKYRYTIQLRYKTNFSNLGFGTNPIEFGWDIPVVDCGMREKGTDGKLKTIMQIDEETGEPLIAVVMDGHAVKGKLSIRTQGNVLYDYQDGIFHHPHHTICLALIRSWS